MTLSKRGCGAKGRSFERELAGSRPSRRRPMPPDFVEHAKGLSISRLSDDYRAGTVTVIRWCAEAGIVPPRVRCDQRPIPDDFAAVAPGKSINDLRKHYQTHHKTISRWFAESGIVPTRYDNRAPKAGHRRKHSYHRQSIAVKRQWKAANLTRRDDSLEGRAADFLRPLAPVHRCSEQGSYDPKGAFWRYGSAILSSLDLLERAIRRGFDPEAWRNIGMSISDHEADKARAKG